MGIMKDVIALVILAYWYFEVCGQELEQAYI